MGGLFNLLAKFSLVMPYRTASLAIVLQTITVCLAVWGGRLSALRLEDRTLFQVASTRPLVNW